MYVCHIIRGEHFGGVLLNLVVSIVNAPTLMNGF
jgi:hypothetical protein